MPFEDETLMAFADGELPEPQASLLRQALDSDPALAARVEAFRQSRAAAAALKPAPVSGDLEARIRALAAARAAASAPAPEAEKPAEPSRLAGGAEIVDLSSRRRRIPLWQAAAAAAAALALGLGLGAGLKPEGSAAETRRMELAALLDSLPSGEIRALGSGAGAAEISVVASFQDRFGSFCREYREAASGRATVTVACREEQGGWTPRLVLAAGPDAGYEPVSSLAALDAWLEAEEAGAPLSLPEEAEILQRR